MTLAAGGCGSVCDMSLFGKKQPASEPVDLRELLYGDVPLERWAESSGGVWAEAASLGADPRAVDVLTAITQDDGAETRDRLVALAALRSRGVPTGPAGQVMGVVLDVPLSGGRDTLAVYRDGSVRYFNHAGGMTFGEPSGLPFADKVQQLVAAGQELAQAIGLWNGPRPPLPPGVARISLLCCDGLYFGQGEPAAFMTDRLAAPVFRAGTELLGALSALQKST